jgi:hypothetical protein
MTLLSGLLKHAQPMRRPTQEHAAPTAHPINQTPPLALAQDLVRTPSHVSADTATPEWCQARDQYLNHIMACPTCYAPTARYCPAGADLRAAYDRIPMEAPFASDLFIVGK